jgi:hypothetical protein
MRNGSKLYVQLESHDRVAADLLYICAANRPYTVNIRTSSSLAIKSIVRSQTCYHALGGFCTPIEVRISRKRQMRATILQSSCLMTSRISSLKIEKLLALRQPLTLTRDRSHQQKDRALKCIEPLLRHCVIRADSL